LFGAAVYSTMMPIFFGFPRKGGKEKQAVPLIG
jgi:hypothetical protein